jgi:hypothetical protein
MRLVKVASYYGSYVRSFYGTRRGLARLSYVEQLGALLKDCFSWADFYDEPLGKLGYETIEVIRDAGPLQRQWAREHGLGEDASLEEITAKQIAEARPDVLWFEDSSDGPPAIVRLLEEAGLRPRLVMGWTGSYIPETDAYRAADVTLSCAPETVEYLRGEGCTAEHLDHAFAPAIPARMRATPIQSDLTFFGNILRIDGFHRERATVLQKIVERGGRIRIYSPQLVSGTKNPFRLWLRAAKSFALYPLKLAVYAAAHCLLGLGASKRFLTRNRLLRRALELEGAPRARAPGNDLPPDLFRHSFPAVFGLEMYAAIASSRVVLNVHADSSPRFASNMRLFEVTGVGSLLLTDWRENLPTLFSPESEVVTYRSIEECMEKIGWLLDHEKERAQIAHAGMVRCHKDHNFDIRAARLDQIIRRRLH